MKRSDIKKIQANLLDRYQKHGRKFPWRETQDPYAIHVSEIMLQQTQAERVVPYFLQWMKKFPDYQTLAYAKKSDLLKHWSGLGFNMRALRLQKAALLIVNTPGIMLDKGDKSSLEEIRKKLLCIPGIGPYTSAALMAFAWNLPVPVIDTNIRRVLIFLFKLDENITPKKLEAFAKEIIPKGKSRDWHNALMDYGALVLTARKTKIKSLSKQSKFEGSNRQVRGWILKQLVKTGKLRIQKVKEEFPYKDVKKIIIDMVKDGLIIVSKGILVLAE